MTPRVGFSRLRFRRDSGAEYPAWEEKKLGEIATYLKGAALSKADISEDGTPFILYGELYTTYNEIASKIARKTTQTVSDEYISRVGDVLIPTSGETPEEISTATCVMVPGVVLAGDLYIVRTDVLDGRILSYLLNHQANTDIAKIAQGKSIVHLRWDALKKIAIIYPTDSEEQQKIADFLSTVDAKIAAQKDKLKSLEEAKKGLIQQIFSQQVRFRQDDGTTYPEWEEKKLGDVGTLKNGYAFNSHTYTSDGQYIILTISNVQGNRYVSNLENCNKIANLPNNICQHQILEEGDILISLTGNVGRVSLNVGKNNLLNQRVGLFDISAQQMSQEFIFQYLSTEQFRKTMELAGVGGSQLNISKESVEKYTIMVPCLEEQQKIADFLSTFDTKIAAVQKKIEAWETIKKGLMQRLFV